MTMPDLGGWAKALKTLEMHYLQHCLLQRPTINGKSSKINRLYMTKFGGLGIFFMA